MDAKLKVDWMKALRSGEYPQTKLSLRNDSGFCCLGVLCDLMGGQWRPDGEVVVNGMVQAGYLDNKIGEPVGLSEAAQEELYAMNDAGKSFAEIADHIEANL